MPISRGAASDSISIGACSGVSSFSTRSRFADATIRPAAASRSGGDAARKTGLAQTIEAEIIPRLMIAHSARGGAFASATPPSDGGSKSKADFDEFMEVVATQDAATATAHVARLLDQGMTVEAAYLDLLTPAARRFGEQWDLDLVDFTDVGLGLTKLHQVMTAIGERAPVKPSARKARRRVLLVSMRDEMHNFGLFMVASFFRRANWDVFGWPLMTDQELIEVVRNTPFHVIGISVSSSQNLDRARAAIALIRKASHNRAVRIMIGGPHLYERPDIAVEIGADATSPDGLRAVDMANQLVKTAAGSSWS